MQPGYLKRSTGQLLSTAISRPSAGHGWQEVRVESRDFFAADLGHPRAPMGSLSRGAVLTPDHLDTVTLLHCLLCSQQKNLDLSHFKTNIVTMLTLCFFLPITNHHNRAGSISVIQCVCMGGGVLNNVCLYLLFPVLFVKRLIEITYYRYSSKRWVLTLEQPPSLYAVLA